jgi:hypothetical protein
MPDVKEGQIWKVYEATSGSWWRIRITNVLREEVEYQFIDRPAASDLDRTRIVRRVAMRRGQQYRLVSDGALGTEVSNRVLS